MKRTAKEHYHWLVALIIFVETIIFGGIINSFVIYTVPIVEDLGISYGAFSIATLPYGIVSFLSSLAAGVLFRRFGYRKIAVISLLISAAGMGLMSCSENLLTLGISRALFGVGFGAGFTAGAVLIIKNWFMRHQGLMLGIVTMASGIGGSIMTTVLTKIIVSTGWRMAALFSGLLLVLVSIFYLFIRNHPREMGLEEFGKNSQASNAKPTLRKDHWVGYPGKVIMGKPLFYLTCLAVTLSCICVNITSTTIVAFFRDAGYSTADASAFNSTLMITLAVAKLAAGWFSDRFGAKRLTFLCLIFTAVGQFLPTVPSPAWLSHISVGIFSVSLCMTSITIPLMTVPLFGYRGSLEVNSYILSMPPLATLIATPIVNFARDHFGNYTVAYRAAFAFDLLIIVLFIAIFAIAKREQKRYAQAQSQ